MEFCRFLRSVKFVVRSLGRFLGRGVCLWLQRSQGSHIFEKLAHFLAFLVKVGVLGWRFAKSRTDQQWDDIASFCCNDIHGHKAILYVDVTFQLGSFFVLVTSYQNTTLYTKKSSPPVCPVLLGPIMLRTLKDKASYVTLFQKMTAR